MSVERRRPKGERQILAPGARKRIGRNVRRLPNLRKRGPPRSFEPNKFVFVGTRATWITENTHTEHRTGHLYAEPTVFNPRLAAASSPCSEQLGSSIHRHDEPMFFTVFKATAV